MFGFQTHSCSDVCMSLSAWTELVSLCRGARVPAHAQGFCCLEKGAGEVTSRCNPIFTQLVLAQGGGTGTFSGGGGGWGCVDLSSMVRSAVAGGQRDKEGAVQSWTQYDKKARCQQA